MSDESKPTYVVHGVDRGVEPDRTGMREPYRGPERRGKGRRMLHRRAQDVMARYATIPQREPDPGPEVTGEPGQSFDEDYIEAVNIFDSAIKELEQRIRQTYDQTATAERQLKALRLLRNRYL